MSLHIFRVTFDTGEEVTGTGKNVVQAIYAAVAVRNSQEYAIAKEIGNAEAFRPINAEHVVSCVRVKRFQRDAVAA